MTTRQSNGKHDCNLRKSNSSAQNQSRAMLAGALVGAQVGLAGIPRRFLDGLERADELQNLARALASQVSDTAIEL